MSQLEPGGENALEHRAFQVEEGATSIEAKVDEIITGNQEVKDQLRQRTAWFAFCAAIFFLILMVLCVQQYRFNSIATSNRAINKSTNEIARVLAKATGPEAQQRNADVISTTVDDIRRSLDCNTNYIKFNEVSDACKDVIERDEALRPPH